MYSVDLHSRVRRACHVEDMSIREAARVFGLHRETVFRMLLYSAPPGYRRSKPVRRPRLDAFTGVIDRILDEDRSAPRKQRHTAKRIFGRRRDAHGFTGGYTIVKDYVRERRLRCREVFVALAHDPGHAQVAFAEALVVIAGIERKGSFPGHGSAALGWLLLSQGLSGKKIKGRKRHIVTDTLGLMVGLIVHSADIQDRDGAPEVLKSIRHAFPWLRHVFADGGYAGPKLRGKLAKIGDWTMEIVKRSDTAEGFEVIPRRWVVERTFAWLNRCRRLAKDWEKTSASAEAWILIAHIRIATRRLARYCYIS